MPVKNTHYLDVDTKLTNYISVPRVTQYDDVFFIVRILDDGRPVSLASVQTFLLASLKPNKETVYTVGTVNEDEITFKIESTALNVKGRIQAAVQLHYTDGRTSTIPFYYEVIADSSVDYVPDTSETSLIQLVLGDAPFILEAAQTATIGAEDATALTFEALDSFDVEKSVAIQELDDVKEDNRITWKQEVATVALRDSTYPTPQIGDTVRITGEARIDRFNGTEWITTDRYNPAVVDELTGKLADTSRQITTLSTGASVVSASVDSLATVEIEGRTLINLLGRSGRTALAATVTVETPKFYLFVAINQTTGAVTFAKYTGQTTLSLTWASGEFAALYEVESANYAKIGVEWDSVAIGLRYPYVDDVKHLQGIGVVAEGENLLPNFYDPAWELISNAIVVNPYELNYTIGVNTIFVPVVPNQTYRLESDSTTVHGIFVHASHSNNVVGTQLVSTASESAVFTVPSNVYYIRIQFYRSSTGSHNLKNPMLTLGNVAKPFVPRNPSYLYADVKLGAVGDKKDVLIEQDGRWILRESIKKSESLTLASNVATLAANAVAGTAIITDGEGTVFNRVTTLSGSGNEFTQSGSGNRIITFNANNLPSTPVASYVLVTAINTDVTDKVEGSLKVNGLTQISVDSGYRRTVVDGKSAWIKGSKSNYTANPVAIKLTYANNIRSAVDNNVEKTQDNATQLSVHEKAIVDLYVRVKALEAK